MLELTEMVEITKVIKQNPETVKLLRESMRPKCHLDEKRFDWHHKVPLSLGGANNSGNLVILDKSIHKYLHTQCIDPQVKGMEVGDVRYIALPKSYNTKSKEWKDFKKVMKMLNNARSR